MFVNRVHFFDGAIRMTSYLPSGVQLHVDGFSKTVLNNAFYFESPSDEHWPIIVGMKCIEIVILKDPVQNCN